MVKATMMIMCTQVIMKKIIFILQYHLHSLSEVVRIFKDDI